MDCSLLVKVQTWAQVQVIIPLFILWKDAVGQAVQTHEPGDWSAQLGSGGFQPSPLSASTGEGLGLLPAPQRFSCHGSPFGSVFGFSWKSHKVLVCSRCGMGTFSDAFRGFVGMRRPSSHCEHSQAGCAGLAHEVSEQHGGAECPWGTVHPLTSAASCVHHLLLLAGRHIPSWGAQAFVTSRDNLQKTKDTWLCCMGNCCRLPALATGFVVDLKWKL